jgi:hypothetical protein
MASQTTDSQSSSRNLSFVSSFSAPAQHNHSSRLNFGRQVRHLPSSCESQFYLHIDTDEKVHMGSRSETSRFERESPTEASAPRVTIPSPTDRDLFLSQIQFLQASLIKQQSDEIFQRDQTIAQLMSEKAQLLAIIQNSPRLTITQKTTTNTTTQA